MSTIRHIPSVLSSFVPVHGGYTTIGPETRFYDLNGDLTTRGQGPPPRVLEYDIYDRLVRQTDMTTGITPLGRTGLAQQLAYPPLGDAQLLACAMCAAQADYPGLRSLEEIATVFGLISRGDRGLRHRQA